MTRPTLSLLTVTLALSGASACSNDTSPTIPTPPAATQVLQGVWSGTIATPNGEVRVRMTLQSVLDGSAERAAGTYDASLGDATTSGNATGVNVLGGASLLFTPSGPPRCPVDAGNATAGSLLFAARPDGNRLSGTGAWTQCAATVQVPVALMKN